MKDGARNYAQPRANTLAKQLRSDLHTALEENLTIRLNPSHLAIKYNIGFGAAKGVIEYLRIEFDALGFASEKVENTETVLIFPRVANNGKG